MQITEYFLLALSLIFRYKLGMGKGLWVYADSILCEDWKGRISSYDFVPVLQKLDFCVDLSTSQGVYLVSRLLLFGYNIFTKWERTDFKDSTFVHKLKCWTKTQKNEEMFFCWIPCLSFIQRKLLPHTFNQIFQNISKYKINFPMHKPNYIFQNNSKY
jgi:hypothetical protein